MQKEINLRTSASHSPLPSTGKLEKKDLVILSSFYEFKQGKNELHPQHHFFIYQVDLQINVKNK